VNKEIFCNLVNAIIAQLEHDKKMGAAIDILLDGELNRSIAFVTPLTDKVITAIDDEYDNLSWWLFDAPQMGKCEDSASCTVSFPKTDEIYVLRTPEDLWIYMYGEKAMTNSDKTIEEILFDQYQLGRKHQETSIKGEKRVIGGEITEAKQASPRSHH